MGFVTADGLAVANFLTDLFRFTEHCFTRPLDDRHCSAFAQRQIEYLAAQLDKPFKFNMMFVMQSCYRRFQLRTKIASRFQAFWQFPALHFAAAWADHFILLRFDHHRFDLWQFRDLAADHLCWNLIQQVDVTGLAIVHKRIEHFVWIVDQRAFLFFMPKFGDLLFGSLALLFLRFEVPRWRL